MGKDDALLLFLFVYCGLKVVHCLWKKGYKSIIGIDIDPWPVGIPKIKNGSGQLNFMAKDDV